MRATKSHESDGFEDENRGLGEESPRGEERVRCSAKVRPAMSATRGRNVSHPKPG